MHFTRLVSAYVLRAICIRFLVLAATVSAFADTTQQVYAFSRLAGPPGGNDGAGAAARFNRPWGAAVDSTGNVYVADNSNHTIRKITPAGVVSTLAGSPGKVGSMDGTGADARFRYPEGVAVDQAGTVYVADSGNRTIRRITSAGIVTTLAGSAGEIGGVDGSGAAARFYRPHDVAVDQGGNVYVTDSGTGETGVLETGSTLRKITPDGVVTTLAGTPARSGSADGTESAAEFHRPFGLAVDGVGNVFVADTYNSIIRKVTPAGVVTTYAGVAGQTGSADGVGAAARFNYPAGIAVDSAGNVYVSDTGNGTIRKITSAAVVTTLGPPDRLTDVRGIAVDGNGHVYFVDTGEDTIGKIAADGAVTLFAGAAGRFGFPSGVAVDHGGNVYVADVENHAIRRITPTGEVSTFAGFRTYRGYADGRGSEARFDRPRDVAVDGNANVYVADMNNHVIRKITPEGLVTTLAGAAQQGGSADGAGAAAQFYHPQGVGVDRDGNVYVADTGNATIRRINPAGVVTTLAGSAGQTGSSDGVGATARFFNPNDVAADADGNVYVADSRNSTIRKITPAGVVTTLAGSAGQNGSVDGLGGAARFNEPYGVAVDRAGSIYVADTYNHAIRKITSGGLVTTVAGMPGQEGDTDGAGAIARFIKPYGVAVSDAGELYVADTFNHAIRRGGRVPASQIVNLSTRSFVDVGDRIQIAGFVITGSQPKQILIRASGPALASANLAGVLPDPVLTLFDRTGAAIRQNIKWAGDAAIKIAAQRVGAFPWPDDSADSALLVTLSPGLYTAQVAGASGSSGTALIEIYDADSSPSNRLINISTRSLVGTGSNLQIAGFVITGSQPKQVLIRAGGPILASAFDMTGVLQAPVLKLFDRTGAEINQNAGWSSDATTAPLIRAAAARVGAFAWPTNSADSALLVTLPPGLYSAHVTGKEDKTGTALLEVYDADP